MPHEPALMPNPNVTFRPATSEDSAAIAEIMRTAFAEHRGKILPDSSALRETAESAAEFLRTGQVFLAEIAGRPIGCVQAKLEGDTVYLGRLSVLPESRRRGVAAGLMARVEDYAREVGAASVMLKVRIALSQNQRIFLSRGYREVGRETHAGFDRPTSIRMQKPVNAR
ncbi:MAG TPA: GNAT family N-acetyltransferase [Stellaceae bacterium]|nr:GNAT family N-acetyltransferase [Stellaceae bacterium]